MLPILIVLGVAVLVAGCGGEEPPPSPRTRPEDPPDGAPPFEENPDQDPLVQQAEERVGASFDVYVKASKGSREGCGLIRVGEVAFAPSTDGRSVPLSGTARWAAYPPSFAGGGQVGSETAYRAGDFPISWFTEEYPEHGTLGLLYMVTGTYDVEGQRLRMMMRNVNQETGGTSDVFLSPVYESWTSGAGGTVTCQAQDDFGNEFLVEAAAGEAEITLASGIGEGVLCDPCLPPVDSIRLEIP